MIQIHDISDLSSIREVFLDVLDVDPRSLKFPFTKDDLLVIGMSGGADSTVLGLMFAAFFPEYKAMIRYIFTDTGAEPESAYQTLNDFENMTGATIDRIKGDRDFFELIDDHNQFLPSFKQRYCTSKLKLKPLQDYFDRVFKGKNIFNAAGIRADEADREGLSFVVEFENQKFDRGTYLPFIELGVTKRQVFEILNRTIGIPSTYAYKSRSGCFLCFFMRLSEYVGMLIQDPNNFKRTEELEKVTADDKARWPVPNIEGLHRIPSIPKFTDIRFDVTSKPSDKPYKIGTKTTAQIDDLFGAAEEEVDTLYVAQAIYIHPMLAMYGHRDFTSGAYWSEFVTLSTSFAGLNAALSNYYELKRTTPSPLYNFEHMQIVVSQITFPKGVIDTKPPSSESFTWRTGIALQQLRHLVGHALLALSLDSLKREIQINVDTANSTDDEFLKMDALEYMERDYRLYKELNTRSPKPGTVVWQGLYRPSLKAKDKGNSQMDLVADTGDSQPNKDSRANPLASDSVPMACAICSL